MKTDVFLNAESNGKIVILGGTMQEIANSNKQEKHVVSGVAYSNIYNVEMISDGVDVTSRVFDKQVWDNMDNMYIQDVIPDIGVVGGATLTSVADVLAKEEYHDDCVPYLEVVVTLAMANVCLSRASDCVSLVGAATMRLVFFCIASRVSCLVSRVLMDNFLFFLTIG